MIYMVKNNQMYYWEAASVKNMPNKRSENIQKTNEDKEESSEESNKNLKKQESQISMATDNENTHSLPREKEFFKNSYRASKTKGKNLLLDIPFESLQLICHMLPLKDMCVLPWVNRSMIKHMSLQEDIWKLKMFKSYDIRVGYQHIRNVNLLRIDTEMKALHKDALKIMLAGKWNQKLLIIFWFLFFLAMGLIAFPVLLILNEEGVEIPLSVIFLPFTICWLALMICWMILFLISSRTRQKVIYGLCDIKEYKDIPEVRGRKFKHPKFWDSQHYLSKALFYQCLFLIWSYLGIFCKTSIYQDMDYLVMVLISWIPISATIFIKQIAEIYRNMNKKKQSSKFLRPLLRLIVGDTLTTEIDFTSLKKVKDQMENSDSLLAIGNPREVKYKPTKRCWCLNRKKLYFAYGDQFKIKNDRCFDMGLLHSLVIPNLVVGGFLILCALRLDDVIGLNWFVITIPTWFFIIPITVLTILHGITSQNSNVTLFEKIVISGLVPIGFIFSYILWLLKLEEYNDWHFSIIFIPNFVSVIAFYIYTRQLKTVKIAPKPEDNQEGIVHQPGQQEQAQ